MGVVKVARPLAFHNLALSSTLSSYMNGEIMDLQTLERDLLAPKDLSKLTASEQFALLKERAAHIVGEDRLCGMLERCKRDGTPLRVKYGIDATGREIHFGHAVPLFVLRRLQRMGHHVVLLIGDFTARVGDPSGRISTRPMLTESEIKQNADRYADQAGKILDLDKTEVRFNSEWLTGYPLAKFFCVLSGLTVATAMQREDFRKRESITRAELLYSTLMAIDSVALVSELELGGDDQLLNFYDAERVMQNEGMTPESAITTDILLGTTGGGVKMSKSLGNFISVLASAEDMFGKVMSIPDEQLEQWFKLLTDLRDEEWQVLESEIKEKRLHPMEAKRLLSSVIVSQFHSNEAATRAEHDFDTRVVAKSVPNNTRTVTVAAFDATTWMYLIKALGLPNASTGSAARRLIEGGGVHIVTDAAEVTVTEATSIPAQNVLTSLRIGKRTFIKFVIK